MFFFQQNLSLVNLAKFLNNNHQSNNCNCIMNNRKVITTVLVFIFFQLLTFSQDFNYPVKKINGTEYYVYTVELQEGLYSVSKKFGVKQSEIVELNPEVNNGLKAGQILIIPKIKQQTNQTVDNKKVAFGFIEHKVEKKQTLFSISKLYGISIDSIKKHNPQVENGLREGDMLKIPADKALTEKKTSVKKPFCIFRKKANDSNNTVVNNEAQNYILHTVKPHETLYSISKLYQVSIDSIIKLNPESETVLKSNTVLRIPNNVADEKKPETNISDQTAEKPVENNKPAIVNTNPIKIAYLLPLMLEQTKVDGSNEKFVDFYAGSLLSINEAKNKGISFEIYTFDTEKSEIKLSEILLNPDLRKADLIIGPAYSNQVALISDFARINKINTLIPFTSKIYDIETNPFLFQFNPGATTELNYLTDLIKSKYRKAKIIFAELPETNEAYEEPSIESLLKNELVKHNIDYDVVDITNSESNNFASYLSITNNNLIFFNTEKYSNVNNFINELKLLSENFDITYFKQLGWPDCETSKTKCFYISPFNSDLNSKKLNQYRIEFENNFNWPSSEVIPSYDLLGYDLTNYFIELLKQKGTDFGKGVNSLPVSEGIQSDFKFERISKNSGFINKKLFTTDK